MKKSICLIVFACVLACFSSVSCKQNSEDVIQTVYITPIWKGSFPEPLQNPEIGWAYYNTTDKKSYIYDGEKWKEMEQDDPSIGNIDNPTGDKKEESKISDDKTQQHDENDSNGSDVHHNQENESINTENTSDSENNEDDQGDSIKEIKQSDGSVVIQYYENDKLVSSVTVSSDGIKLFDATYYENGKRKTCNRYNEKGVLLRSEIYFENGFTKSLVNYENGKKKSESTFYEDHDQEKTFVWYDENEIIEQKSDYDENGKETVRYVYENGIIQTKTEYDVNGKLIVDEVYENGIIRIKGFSSEIDGHEVWIHEEYDEGVLSYVETSFINQGDIYNYYKKELYYLNEKKKTIYTYDENRSPVTKEEFTYYDSGKLKTHAYYNGGDIQKYLETFYENGKKEINAFRSDEDNECILYELYDENENLKEKRIYYNKEPEWVSIYEKEIYSDTEYKKVIYNPGRFDYKYHSFFDLQRFSGTGVENHAYTYDENGKLISHIYTASGFTEGQSFEYYSYFEDSYIIEFYQVNKIIKSQTYNEQDILVSESIYNYSNSELRSNDVYTYYENGVKKTWSYYTIDDDSEFRLKEKETYDINGNVLTRESSAGKETYSYDEFNRLISYLIDYGTFRTEECHSYDDNGIKRKLERHTEAIYPESGVDKTDVFYLYYPDGKTERIIWYTNNVLNKYELYYDDENNTKFYYCERKTNNSNPDIVWYREDYFGKFWVTIEPDWNTIKHFHTFYESGRAKSWYIDTKEVLYSFDDKDYKDWINGDWDVDWIEYIHAYSSKKSISNEEVYELYMAEKESIEIDDFFLTLEEYNQNQIN